MNYVLNGKQMKECDLKFINGSLSRSLELIDRASSACIKYLYNKDFDLSNCLIVCGAGNNGADGFAIAKKLMDDGYNAVVIAPTNSTSFSKESENIISTFNCKIISYEDFIKKYDICDFTCIVDALFGIGLSREVKGIYENIINDINDSKAKVLSVDIPSGICSDNGTVMGVAVHANVTVTFARIKIGQLLYPGKEYCGELFLEDIGIPVVDEMIPKYAITDVFDDFNALPYRRPDGNKGSFGKVLVLAGSAEIFGAVYLSAMAAYKAGCGMVHILTEKNNMYSLQQMLPEALLHFYDENHPKEALEKLNDLMEICDVFCVGCGMGVNDTSKLMLDVILNSDKPMVLDADALNIISTNNWKNRLNNCNCILTPHIMEMSRLSGMSVHDIKENPVTLAEDFVNDYNSVLVLKDAVTVVSARGMNTYINRSGNCAMAKAGSGDVLAGIITGFLAQSGDLRKSASLGVYVHGLIGDNMRAKTGEYALLARNLLSGIDDLYKM